MNALSSCVNRPLFTLIVKTYNWRNIYNIASRDKDKSPFDEYGKILVRKFIQK